MYALCDSVITTSDGDVKKFSYLILILRRVLRCCLEMCTMDYDRIWCSRYVDITASAWATENKHIAHGELFSSQSGLLLYWWINWLAVLLLLWQDKARHFAGGSRSVSRRRLWSASLHVSPARPCRKRTRVISALFIVKHGPFGLIKLHPHYKCFYEQLCGFYASQLLA